MVLLPLAGVQLPLLQQLLLLGLLIDPGIPASFERGETYSTE
jgi:hypothetical protein